jgi:ElaB/YqjD/DUF883 family membrane-anchored ribosome-binding protein
MWGLAERKSSRFNPDLDMADVYDQLDTLRGYVQELSRSVGKSADHSYGRAKAAAQDAEDLMKDNLAASLVLALGLGVAIGYFLRRG